MEIMGVIWFLAFVAQCVAGLVIAGFVCAVLLGALYETIGNKVRERRVLGPAAIQNPVNSHAN